MPKVDIFLTDVRISSDGELLVYGQKSADEDEINALMDKLRQAIPESRTCSDIKIGDLCVAKFAEDNDWYRAEVKEKLSDSWLVEFIDYGNMQATHLEDMRSMPGQFQTLKPYVQLYVLQLDAAPVNSAGLWATDVTGAIQSDFLYGEVKIEVSGSEPCVPVARCDAIREALLKKRLIAGKLCHPFSSFAVDTQFEALLSNCCGTGGMHLQAKKSMNDLDKLMDDMATFYTCDDDALQKLLIPRGAVKIGMLVTSVYGVDGGFYRAQVRSVVGNKCMVFYIDYGDSEDKSIQCLYKLPEKFCVLDYQAITCQLSGISYLKNVAVHVITDAINEFALEKTLKVTVKLHEPPFCLLVEVEDSQSHSSLARHLVENGCAKLAKACDTADNHMACLELTAGEKINMILTCVEMDGSFYCYSTANENQLNQQLDMLYEVCSNPDAEVLKNKSPKAVCCAPYSADGNWYRAELAKIDGEEAFVRFVDYGNTATCPADTLLHLPDQLCKLPMQAVHCILSSHLKGSELISTLNAIKDEEVVVEVVNSDTKPYVVRLYRNGTVVGIQACMQDHVEKVNPKQNPDVVYKKRVVTLGARKEVLLKQTADLRSLWCVLVETNKELQALAEEMNEIYAVLDADTFLPEDYDAELPCVVRDTKDGFWHRSKVLKPSGPGMFTVLYVDCGAVEVVPKEAIKVICPDLLKHPVFGLKFVLTGLKTVSGADAPLDQYQALIQAAKDKVFVAVFKSYDPGKELYFLELQDAAGHLNIQHRPTNDVSSLPPALPVEMNLELPVRITTVEGPDCIWVQLLDHQADLIRLTTKMNTFYDSVPEQALTLDSGEYGKICCFKSARNKNWCRGVIIYSYEETIEVKFLDFGYEESAYMKDAKMLLPEFSTLPALALRCCLDNLRPNSSRWTNASTRFLKDFAAKTGVSAEFLEHKVTTYSVIMYVTNKSGKLLIGKCMVDQGLAAWIDTDVAAASIEKLKMNRPLGQQADQVPTANGTKHPSDPVSPTARLFYHQPGISLIGAEVPVRVCDLANPSDFFILPRNRELQLTYKQLFGELKRRYSSESPPITDMYIGMPCIYISDKACCRAAIVGKEDPTHPTVFLVDFGEKVAVLATCLKLISAEHVNCLAPVAIRCTLHGIVEPRNQFWSSKAVLSFSKFCKENQNDTVCSVHGCVSDGVSQFFMVELSTPFVNVAELLVNEGNCQKTTPMGKMQPPFHSRSFVYSNLGMGIGKEDLFYVTHVARPDLFYSQLGSRYSDIDCLMDKLQEYCSRRVHSNPVTLKDLVFSPTCFVKYEDGKWYRAHYDSPCGNLPNHVNVTLVDFGNTVALSLTNIMLCSYSAGLADVPILALPCCLSEITSPVQNPGASEHLLQEMEENLLNRQLPGMITGATNGRFHLDLFSDGKRVNDTISGVGSPLAVEEHRSKIRDCDPRLREKFKEITGIENKSVHSVFICEVTDPDSFHIRLASYEKQYETCMGEVDGYYTAVRRNDYPVTVLENGNVVCAKHPEMLRWCRGVVVDAESRKPIHALIDFVDLGEKKMVSLEDNTKKLVTDMLIWPKLAIRCQLASVKPFSGSWTPECTSLFSKTILSQSCRIRFNSYDVTQGSWTVDMKIGGKNVTHMLVEKKHAEFINAPSSTTSGTSVCIKMRRMASWPIGTKKPVYISHVESSDEIYLQMTESENELNALMDKLNSPVLNLEKVTPAQVQRDRSYVAKYEDGQWYRANILAADRSANKYSLIYADYGNLSHVKLEDLRLLPKELAELPEQVIKCGVSLEAEVDKTTATSKLEELAAMGDFIIHAKAIELNQTSANLIVDLSVIPPGQSCIPFAKYFNLDNRKVSAVKPATDQQPETTKQDLRLKYSELEIKTGVKTKVYVSQVDGPDRMWIQPSSSAPELDKLMAKIEMQYNSDDARPGVTASDIYDNMPCIAKYTADDGWYRAAIIKTEDGVASIHFTDYGNTEEVRIDELKVVDKEFLTLPAQVVLCSLKGVDKQAWTEKDTDDFVAQVSDVELEAVFQMPMPGTEHQSTLVSTHYEVGLTSPDGKSLNAEWKKLLGDRKTTHRVAVADGKGDRVLAELTEKQCLVETEKHIVSDRGDHVVVENLHFQSTNLDFNASADVKTPTFTGMMLDSLVVDNKELEEGYVSHCEDPGNFYVQLARLSSVLDVVYNQTKEAPERILKEVMAGMYCIAKSPDDGEWYRAKCINNDGDTSVFFIDYGNIATIPHAGIKPITDSLTRIPAQAMHCKLHGIQPIDSSWGTSTDYFLDLALDKDIQITFVELLSDGWWSVRLSVNGVDVSEKMLRDNKGTTPVKSLTHIQPRFTSSTEVFGTKVQPGQMHCVKMVHITNQTDFVLFLVNAPTDLVSTKVAEFISNPDLEKSVEQLQLSDLNVGDKCLLRDGDSEDWILARIVSIADNSLRTVDVSSGEINQSENRTLKLMRASLSLTELADNLCFQCAPDEATDSDTICDLDGSLVVASFVEKDILSGKWLVRLFPIRSKSVGEQKGATVALQPHDMKADEILIPDITITDEEGKLIPDKTKGEAAEGSAEKWLEQNVEQIADSLHHVLMLLADCPPALQAFSTKIFEAQLHFESLTNTEKHVGAQKRPTELSPEKAMLGKSPCKKLKLDQPKSVSGDLSEVSGDESTSEWSFDSGDSFEVVIVNVDSPDMFFVRPYLVLLEPVVKDQTATPHEEEKQKLPIGSHCFAKFSDTQTHIQHWVRSVVRGYEGEKYLLRDFDTNILFNAPQDCAIPLDEDTASFDRLCLQCSLRGVVPHRSDKTTHDWSVEAIEHFKSLVQTGFQENAFKVNIVSTRYEKDADKKVYSVDISINGHSVANKMVEKGFALSKMETSHVDENSDVVQRFPTGGRGVRKPFADLPNIPVELDQRNAGTTSSTNPAFPSADLSKYDLLAIPWPIIRSSSLLSRDDTMSDSVFVSEFDITPYTPGSGQIAVTMKKPLASFRIYCSNSSPFLTNDSLTQTADLSAGEKQTQLSTTEKIAIIDAESAYVPSTPLEPPTPSVVGDLTVEYTQTGNQARGNTILSDVVPRNTAKELKLCEMAKMVIEEVFHSIEEEDETEEMIPDSSYNIPSPSIGSCRKVGLTSIFRKLSSIEITRGETTDTDSPGVDDLQLVEIPSLEPIKSNDEDNLSQVFIKASPEREPKDEDSQAIHHAKLGEIPAQESLDDFAGEDEEILQICCDLLSDIDEEQGNLDDEDLQEIPTPEVLGFTSKDDICAFDEMSSEVQSEDVDHPVVEDELVEMAAPEVISRSTTDEEWNQTKEAEGVLVEIPDPQDLVSNRTDCIPVLKEPSSKMWKDPNDVDRRLKDTVRPEPLGSSDEECTSDFLVSASVEAVPSAIEYPRLQEILTPEQVGIDAQSSLLMIFSEPSVETSLDTDDGQVQEVTGMELTAVEKPQIIDDLKQEVEGKLASYDVYTPKCLQEEESLVDIPQPPTVKIGESPFAPAPVQDTDEHDGRSSLQPYALQPKIGPGPFLSTEDLQDEDVRDSTKYLVTDDLDVLDGDDIEKGQYWSGVGAEAKTGDSNIRSEYALIDEASRPHGVDADKSDIGEEGSVVVEIVQDDLLDAAGSEDHYLKEDLEIDRAGVEDLEYAEETCASDQQPIAVVVNVEPDQNEEGDAMSNIGVSRDAPLESSVYMEETDVDVEDASSATSISAIAAADASELSISHSDDIAKIVTVPVIPTIVVGCETVEEECSCSCSSRKYACCLPKLQLEPGDSYEVSYMDSADPDDIQLQFNMGQDSEEWEEAMRETNKVDFIEDLKEVENWEPDMLCLVRCNNDMSWERGWICDAISEEEFLVELFDYGDMIKATPNQMREMPDSLSVYAPQTFHCTLGNISPLSEEKEDCDWGPSVNEYLKTILFCSTLRVEVTKNYDGGLGKMCTVRLYILEESEENDVGEMLIKANLAGPALEVEKTDEDDKEWSTLTDSAWETVLHPENTVSDLLHSSNVDLSSSAEFGGEEEISKDSSRETVTSEGEVGKGGGGSAIGITFSEEELDLVADEIQRTVIMNAIAAVTQR